MIERFTEFLFVVVDLADNIVTSNPSERSKALNNPFNS